MTNLDNDNAANTSYGQSKGTLTAFYDSRGDAERAIDRLKEARVSDVRLMPGYEDDGDAADVGGDDRVGFWARLEDWLFPDEDRAVYAEGLRRGGFLVSAGVDDATYETAHDILDEHGAIDMDERADQWRSEGWAARLPDTSSLVARRDQGSVGAAGRDQQDAATTDDVFKADAVTRAATGTTGQLRSDDPASSSCVRARDLDEEFPIDDELRDDVLPTGHQRTVEDEADPAIREAKQSQDIDSMRQEQLIPRGR